MTQIESDKFYEMLSGFDTAMLVTHSHGKLIGRPMMIALVEPNCDLWFITAKNTEKTDEIETDSRVLITCQKEKDCYVSLSGTAVVTQDRSRIDELWKESFKVWFPEGKNDPNLALINVHADLGEYWDNEGVSKIKYMFKAAKAYITGTTPKVDEAQQHTKIRL